MIEHLLQLQESAMNDARLQAFVHDSMVHQHGQFSSEDLGRNPFRTSWERLE